MDREYKLLIIAGLIILIIGCIWTYLQWGECRDEGFSILYCLKHIA